MNYRNNFKFVFAMFTLVLFVILFIYSARADFSSLADYCSVNKFVGVSSECVSAVLESGDSQILKLIDFKQLDHTIFNSQKVLNDIISSQDVLQKYSNEILGSNIKLFRVGNAEDFLGKTQFNQNGAITLPSGKSYDLSQISKIADGSNIKITKDDLIFDLKKDSSVDISRLASIIKGNGNIKLDPSEFYLGDKLFNIQSGNAILDSNGISIPRGTSVKFGDVGFKNTGNDLLYISLDGSSNFDNSISFVDNNGLKNVLTKVSPGGSYTLDFSGKISESIGGGNSEQFLFRDPNFGNDNDIFRYRGNINNNYDLNVVKDIQRSLKSLDYYDDGTDGKYGPLTAQAVAVFQADNNLQVDGDFGPETRAALKKINGDYSFISSTGSSVDYSRNFYGNSLHEIKDVGGNLISVGQISGNNNIVIYGKNTNDFSFSENGDVVKTSGVDFNGLNNVYNNQIKTFSDELETTGTLNLETPTSRAGYYGKIPNSVKVVKTSDGDPLVSLSGSKASFYTPRDIVKDPTGGGDITSVGVKFSKLDGLGIPVVAGSDRYFSVGDVVKIVNPLNGKETIAVVLDRVGESTLINRPDRAIDIPTNSEIIKDLGFVSSSSDSLDPNGYGVKDIQFYKIGKFVQKDNSLSFVRYSSG